VGFRTQKLAWERREQIEKMIDTARRKASKRFMRYLAGASEKSKATKVD